MEPAGERLKKIRLEKGVSLEEVQKKTRVSLKILKALEGDSLTDLNPIYLKGFLKIYCKFLGLDPKDYIPDYKETPSVVKDVGAGEYVLQKPEKAASFFKTASLKLSSFRPSKKVKSVLISVLIIIFSSVVLFNLGKIISSKRKVQVIKEKRTSGVSAAKKTEAKKAQRIEEIKSIAVPEKPKPTKTAPQKESSSGIRLIIRAKDNCWVSLKADGRLLFQRVLEKGRFESWQAKERMELSLGNAGAVELEVNGQLFSNLGRRGQAQKNIVITREGLNITR